MGNRYGYRPFPSSIDAEEFDVLIKVADKMDPRGCTTVKEWFQRNDNVVPPVYELQVKVQAVFSQTNWSPLYCLEEKRI